MNNKNVFALDIGTRSVTGIILKKENHTFTVVDFCIKEHKNRSMLDGQIHDIVEVANIIQEVKETLEMNNGPLHKVSVAAAGRSLKTMHAKATIELQQQPIIKQETIKHLELSAVQSAQLELMNQENNVDYSNYYCVGYSTLNYELDDQIIGSLIDQGGEHASVSIIATFLPKVVVESLLAALTRAALEMDALTLEPIAAIQVLVPESMRRLNVALIDIGAGTSDIAITSQGTIAAYGMVPMAGDQITEAISDHYLLDFPVAEQTKRNIVTNGEDLIYDILGFETPITYEELEQVIASDVEKLAGKLATEVMQLNKQAPKAIMLIGGGSLTPNITKELAKQLQLPDNRVAVRNLDAIQNLDKSVDLPSGPDFITPIGIAITALENPIHYINVTVNQKVIQMFEMKQLTIGDCLIQAGIDVKKEYGRPGLASMITVNDRKITLPGEYGRPPTIYLNNEFNSVDQVVQNGDRISIEKGADGKSPHVSIQDVTGDIPMMTVYLNEMQCKLEPTFYVNGKKQSKQYIVNDRDEIVMKQPKTVEDLLSKQDSLNIANTFTVFVNDEKISLLKGQSQIFLNQKEVTKDEPLKNNDHVEITATKTPFVQDLLDQQKKTYSKSINVSFNEKNITLSQQQLTIMRDDKEITPETTLKANDRLEMSPKKNAPFIFQDVFRYVDIDLDHAKGTFKIYKNNAPSAFNDLIGHGDKLEIIWEQKGSLSNSVDDKYLSINI